MWGRVENRERVTICVNVRGIQGFPGGSMVKNLPAKQETQVWSLGQESPLEKEIASHLGIRALEIPWIEEPGRL